MEKLDITFNEGHGFAYSLDVTKENSRSIYAIGMYGNKYKVDKATGNVFIDGDKVAESCRYRKYTE